MTPEVARKFLWALTKNTNPIYGRIEYGYQSNFVNYKPSSTKSTLIFMFEDDANIEIDSPIASNIRCS